MPNDTTTNIKLEDGATIYPHSGVAVIEILKVWTILAIMIGGLYWSSKSIIPPDLRFFANLGCFLLVLGGVLFAMHRLLHYTNTYVEITKDALIYRKGWIPHTSDTIFWVHIKDLNSSSSVTESLLGTGSVGILVAIRNSMVLVKMSYLPNHEGFADFVRERIGKLSDVTRQVTYT
jgi:membrane protein YdbS with pleckstrin-like domain